MTNMKHYNLFCDICHEILFKNMLAKQNTVAEQKSTVIQRYNRFNNTKYLYQRYRKQKSRTQCRVSSILLKS